MISTSSILDLQARLLSTARMPEREDVEFVVHDLVVHETPRAAEEEAPHARRARAFVHRAPMPGCRASSATDAPKSEAIASGAEGRFAAHHSAALRTCAAARAATLTRSGIVSGAAAMTAEVRRG